MKNVVQHESYGEIVCNENVWTGKKTIHIDGQELVKTAKNTFHTQDGKIIKVKGSNITGISLNIGSEKIQLSPKPKWYEWALSAPMFIFILVWGNVVSLCMIFPVIGGAIGGLISALFAFANFVIIRSVKQTWLKVLISVGMTGMTILGCYLIALAIIS